MKPGWLIGGLFAVLLGVSPALAQNVQQLCFNDGTGCFPVTTAHPLPVTSGGGGGAVTQGTSPWVVGQSGAPWSENISQFGGSAVATGAGAGGAGVPRVTVSTDSSVIMEYGTGQAVAATTPLPVTLTPSGTSAYGLTPVVGGSASSGQVLKASAGSLYNAYAVCTSACFLMIFNSATVPADGATTAGSASGNMQDCIPIAAGGTGAVNLGSQMPEVFSAGISAAISSTGCATKTASTVGFIHGQVK